MALNETRGEKDGAHVYLTLTSPAEDEEVTMALETKKTTVALQRQPGRIWIHIKQVQRKAHYVTPPAYDLAQALKRG